MKNNENNKEEDIIISKIKKLFPEVYLTLISIIQASVLGYLIITLNANWFDLTLLNWMLSFTSFLIIIIIWNEYAMGSTIFRWIPRLKDSFLPFLIGISEIIVVHNIVTKLYLWNFSVSLFCFIGLLAYLNMYLSAKSKRNKENDIVFKRLGKLPKITEIWAVCMAIIFFLLGIISYLFDRNQIVKIIIGFIHIIIMIAFLFRTNNYWKRIVNIETE